MVSENKALKFVCPFCYSCYEFKESELSKEKLKCEHCSTSLVMQTEREQNSMKCLDCLLAIEAPEGIWCLKFRGIASEEMAANCGDFLSRNILGDDYEG